MPLPYERLFHGAEAVLASHRGYDIGALGVALEMASRLAAPIVFSTVTRLLIDLNRSLSEPGVFGELTRGLAGAERDEIVASFYAPYRASVERTVAAAIGAGHRVVHIGVHSCTDVLNDRVRDLDIALLFDEARPLEASFCSALRDALRDRAPELRYPFNEPYRGADDGLTTHLRSEYGAADYLGIEVEVRQGMIGEEHQQRQVGRLLSAALSITLARGPMGSPRG